MYCSNYATRFFVLYSRPTNLYTFHVGDLNFKMKICGYLSKEQSYFFPNKQKWQMRQFTNEYGMTDSFVRYFEVSNIIQHP